MFGMWRTACCCRQVMYVLNVINILARLRVMRRADTYIHVHIWVFSASFQLSVVKLLLLTFIYMHSNYIPVYICICTNKIYYYGVVMLVSRYNGMARLPGKFLRCLFSWLDTWSAASHVCKCVSVSINTRGFSNWK